jgi:ELWxxDGT repeat protein
MFSSDPEWLTPWQGKLFFSAVTSGPGRELWVIDEAGGRLVRDLTPTAVNFDSHPTRLTAADGGLLFEAGATNARDVYVTDGTFDNTVRLRDRAGDAAPQLGTLTLLGAMDGWAYFFNVVPDAAPGTVRMELWKWDAGTDAPQKVATLLGPGSPMGSTQALGTADGFLYFRMQSPLGIELWRTDGTGAGTLMVQDLFPGAGHGSPANFATAGGRVYFTATDGTHGAELWSMLMRPAERAEPGVVYRGGAFGDAVAPDKAPLRPGGTASAANVSGYDRGINQIELALPGVLPAGVTADDFEFRVGRGGDPAGWAAAPAPLSVEPVPWQPGADAARYRITWADGAIRNTWLRVTVKDSGRTGLRSADVLLFGSLPGETGDGGFASPAVGAADYAATRARLGRRATIGDVADHNRDGRVDVRDLAVVRRNYFNGLAAVADGTLPATAARAMRRRGAWEGLADGGLG